MRRGRLRWTLGQPSLTTFTLMPAASRCEAVHSHQAYRPSGIGLCDPVLLRVWDNVWDKVCPKTPAVP